MSKVGKCLFLSALSSSALLSLVPASARAAAPEDDYFDNLPVVLTVSRLSQPLSDTPGAVTIIDRDKIRRSAARDVTDLLRLVPGYQVSGWNGANSNGAYHATIDDYGIRNLVLIDGRPVYSSFYLGDTHRGLMSVPLEDIERIEVLRGSNSAAYGANAMFGVINIVTRHTQDTLGTSLSYTGGDQGISDYHLRQGWGGPEASFRLSTSQLKDNGYANAYDNRRLRQTHFRGDLKPGIDQDLLLEAGLTQMDAGEGFANQTGNPLRDVSWQDWYLHGQWSRQLSETDQVKITANYDEEHLTDLAPYTPLPGVMLDAGGRGQRLNLEFQYQQSPLDNVRTVWGMGYKHEAALSQALYAKSEVSFNEWRGFGNVEWHITPSWLLNAGLFIGQHSWTGTYLAPRLMFNFQVAPDHTLRAGISGSARPPSLFELASDVRYYQNGNLIGRTFTARADARPETLVSQELGYFGNFRDLDMTLDVRVYHERMKTFIDSFSYALTPALPATGTAAKDFVNYPGLYTRGIEYQWRWKPLEGSELWLNQNFQHYQWDDINKNDHQPPTYSTTVALFQQLPYDFDLNVIYHLQGKMTWRSQNDTILPYSRLDVKLARPFRVDGHKVEGAVTVQAANGALSEYLPSQHFLFERRTFFTLKLEL